MLPLLRNPLVTSDKKKKFPYTKEHTLTGERRMIPDKKNVSTNIDQNYAIVKKAPSLNK